MEQLFTIHEGRLSIPCNLCVSEYQKINRVVLGVHGLGGSSRDDIQESLAEEMELFSSAVFRFDFPAHGENPMEEFTLEACRDTLLAVAAEAKRRFPEVEDLCIFATGFGAYVTLTALEELLELPGKVKLVVQTPSVMMHSTLLSMIRMSKETFWAMDRYTFHTRRPFTVRYSFYEELERNIVLNSYPVPMLILHGDADSYIRMEDIQNFRRINEDSKLVVIPGISHRFTEEGAWDMVLDLTRDWFEFEQVLLADCY